MPGRPALIYFLPMMLFGIITVPEVLHGRLVDLYIYRGGAELGWRGESPYSSKISEQVAAKWPEDESLIRNCGFFLPPQAIVLFGPFAAVPWPVAKILYTLLTLLALAACWYGLAIAFRDPPRLNWPPIGSLPWLLPWLICLHLITIMTYKAGQTTLLTAAAITLGQLAHERGRPWLGGLLWACAFVKPHIALPLLVLAGLFDGGKRAIILVAWLAALNIMGCLLAGGSPLFALDYLHFLESAHKQVEYNRVGWNFQITSWNRCWWTLSGQAIEMNLPLTLVGYGVFALVALVRCGFRRPSKAWLLAVAMTAAVFCSQVLAYESFLLVLCVPFILESLEQGRKVTAYVIVGLLVAHMLPLELMGALGFPSYRCWLVAALAGTLLASGGRHGR